MSPVLVCGDTPARDFIDSNGIGFCYVHGYQKVELRVLPTEPTTPPEPTLSKVVLTVKCPHCGEVFDTEVG